MSVNRNVIGPVGVWFISHSLDLELEPCAPRRTGRHAIGAQGISLGGFSVAHRAGSLRDLMLREELLDATGDLFAVRLDREMARVEQVSLHGF